MRSQLVLYLEHNSLEGQGGRRGDSYLPARVSSVDSRTRVDGRLYLAKKRGRDKIGLFRLGHT